MKGNENQIVNYFDKRTSEEDLPVNFDVKIHEKYEKLEGLFDKFFDSNSLALAKVLN